MDHVDSLQSSGNAENIDNRVLHVTKMHIIQHVRCAARFVVEDWAPERRERGVMSCRHFCTPDPSRDRSNLRRRNDSNTKSGISVQYSALPVHRSSSKIPVRASNQASSHKPTSHAAHQSHTDESTRGKQATFVGSSWAKHRPMPLIEGRDRKGRCPHHIEAGTSPYVA